MIQKGVHVEAARGERGRPPAPPWPATDWVADDICVRSLTLTWIRLNDLLTPIPMRLIRLLQQQFILKGDTEVSPPGKVAGRPSVIGRVTQASSL